jgi:hypothetical protein
MNSVGGRNIAEGLLKLREVLYRQGYNIQTQRWQGTEEPPVFLEILHASMKAKMYSNASLASLQLGATQPWADVHFDERVSGEPLNPPPSHTMWLKDTDKYMGKKEQKAFSHSYPERLWAPSMDGIRFKTGNLHDAVEFLKSDPTTRQCYVPMWFPEDITAALEGERVPCSFGWHFMLRDHQLHCAYHMRSCDVVRHLHNDLYFANRLTMWMIDQADLDAEPGYLHFSSTSLHCFENDRFALKQLIGDTDLEPIYAAPV